MEYLWRSRGVAVIGASATPGSVGSRVLGYLRAHGYAGAIYPVNPRLREVEGLACFPTVTAIPGPVDLALVCVGAERVQAVVAELAAKGVGFAVLFSSGFGETGAPGLALEVELVALARAHGLRLLGPNCIGLVSPADRLVAGFSPLFGAVQFEPGSIGLVAQSGALGFGIASLALERGLHFSRIITTGNEADLCTAELVRALLLDEATQTVLVYAEGLKAAPAWRELGALSVRVGKPVIMLKAGRTERGARAAQSHTAALAGDDQVWDAAFRQLGFIRVDDVDAMLDVAVAFAAPRRPAGARVAVLTTSGGAGILAADALEQVELPLAVLQPETEAALRAIIPPFGTAANPIDVTAQVVSDPDLFRRALQTLAIDPNVDVLLACFCALQGAEAERVVAGLLAMRAESGKPVVVARTGAEGLAPQATNALRAGQMPVYPSPARAVKAMAALARFTTLVQAARAVGGPPLPALAAAPLPAPGALPPGWPMGAVAEEHLLTERAVKALLRSAGLPVTRDLTATTADEAVQAAAQIGYPVVLKLDSPTFTHKTEAGGVKLNLPDAAAVRAAFAALDAPCLVQPMVTDPVAEVLVGVTPSPIGPVVTVGTGGVLTEVWQDVARRLAPLTPAEALQMLQELKLWRVLCGFRGRPPADVGALADLIARVSELAVTWPGRWELDLNPVFALPTGCLIGDGLLIVQEVAAC